jgi:hypothetical protein
MSGEMDNIKRCRYGDFGGLSMAGHSASTSDKKLEGGQSATRHRRVSERKAPSRDKYPETGMKKTQLRNSWRKPPVGIDAGMMLAGTAGRIL